MSELKADLTFVIGLAGDASLIRIESNCKDMVHDDIYDCGVYDWVAYNLDIEIPSCSFLSFSVDVHPSCWVNSVDEINYSIIDGTVATSSLVEATALTEALRLKELENQQLAQDKAELVKLVESGYKEALRAGYSCGLSDGQCYSSNKISMNVDEEWLESMTIESLGVHKCD